MNVNINGLTYDNILGGKCVVLGVTGGIAAYKMATVTSMLKKLGADVHVIMTKHATEFITPLTFETLSGNRCVVDTFDRNFKYDVEHISIAKAADVIMIAPATANTIAKLSNGIADDMLTTVVLAASCPKIVSPSMNTGMLNNPITQDNIDKLKKYNFEVIDSEEGLLACNDTGKGKMPEPEILVQHILKSVAREKDLIGKKIVVTAGPTREAIDPVRYITNHSTGKMGYAIATEAMLRGADVTLISGPSNLPAVPFVNMISTVSALDMFNAVKESISDADVLIKSAAVADYRPDNIAQEKIKKSDSDMSISLERTDDILGYVKDNKNDKLFVCGFSMETENMLENSGKKLEKKSLDMIIANNVKVKGAGFGTDTNFVTIITKDNTEELPGLLKIDVAHEILNRIINK